MSLTLPNRYKDGCNAELLLPNGVCYAWLEREGFDYDLYSEGAVARGTLPLDKYRVLIISVHPEYWTREMYLK